MHSIDNVRIDEDSITEFSQLSRSFNKMLVRISRAYDAQRQFTGNAAHELRTPLALMQTQLDTYAEGTAASARRRPSPCCGIRPSGYPRW